MTSLIRWRPSYELAPWESFERWWGEELEDLFENLPEASRGRGETFRWAPRVETFQKNGSYVVKADLPGVNAKDIHVTVDGGYLNIRGERKTDRETRKKNLHRRELFYGSFQRSLPIPKGLKAEEIKAKYHDGVLEITAPLEKALPARELKIEVEKGV